MIIGKRQKRIYNDRSQLMTEIKVKMYEAFIETRLINLSHTEMLVFCKKCLGRFEKRMSILTMGNRNELYGYEMALWDVVRNEFTINVWSVTLPGDHEIFDVRRLDSKGSFWDSMTNTFVEHLGLFIDRDGRHEIILDKNQLSEMRKRPWYHERMTQYVGRVWKSEPRKAFSISDNYKGEVYKSELQRHQNSLRESLEQSK